MRDLRGFLSFDGRVRDGRGREDEQQKSDKNNNGHEACRAVRNHRAKFHIQKSRLVAKKAKNTDKNKGCGIAPALIGVFWTRFETALKQVPGTGGQEADGPNEQRLSH